MGLVETATQYLTTTNLALALASGVIYVLSLYIYRAYFDSLSHIPGPKLAAATLWYEFYYDVVKMGRYTWKIGELHEKYGPIIRISPYEVHINDPEFIDEIYPGSSIRTEKYEWSMRMFGLKHAFLVTQSHELHRIRRGVFAHYFSKASLTRLEPGIQSMVDKMVSRLHECQGNGQIINLLDVFACLTGDIIGQYAYAKPFGFLDDKNFSPDWHKLMMEVSMNSHMSKQFGWLMPLMMSLPDFMVKKMNPLMMTLINFQRGFRKQILDVKSDLSHGKQPKGQTNIFYEVLTNPDVRPQEKDTDYLQDEAQTIIGAGTVTTAHILSILAFYINDNPSILTRLQSELATVVPTSDDSPPPKWAQLERLPYLTAVIAEGMRIGYGVSQRLQRLFPDKVIHYDRYAIPTMTPISMSAVLIHDNPSLFPDPRTFDPDRFLHQPELKRYLMTFAKGSRQCAGLNLAYAELYLGLCAVFAPERFRFKFFETDVSDVETKHDFLNTSPRLDSKGIRVTIE